MCMYNHTYMYVCMYVHISLPLPISGPEILCRQRRIWCNSTGATPLNNVLAPPISCTSSVITCPPKRKIRTYVYECVHTYTTYAYSCICSYICEEPASYACTYTYTVYVCTLLGRIVMYKSKCPYLKTVQCRPCLAGHLSFLHSLIASSVSYFKLLAHTYVHKLPDGLIIQEPLFLHEYVYIIIYH